MLKPEIISPASAREMYDKADTFGNETDERLMGRTEFALCYTVATEPDRIRAAVVKALDTYARMVGRREASNVRAFADAIKNGADYAVPSETSRGVGGVLPRAAEASSPDADRETGGGASPQPPPVDPPARERVDLAAALRASVEAAAERRRQARS